MPDALTDGPLNRRGFLGLTLLALPAFLASCAAPRSEPSVSASPSPPSSTPASSTPETPPRASARPELSRSYGPNGTHWPGHTPWIGDAEIVIVEVSCAWAAIGDALAAVTAEQAAAGLRISVAPGTLTGEGASSGSAAMLEKLGSADWAQNILVSPRDGWGTVTISGPARLRDVHGVTFARIDGDDILLTNCTRTAWAHAKMSKGLRMASSYGATTRECGAYEIVMAGAKADIADPLGYAAGEGCVLTDCVWEGCYSAPVFRPTGATDHVDTLQMYGTGWYRGLTVRDSTVFGSLNCALQIGGSRDDDPNRGTPFLTLDHSILTSQATAIEVRYPLPDNADTPKLGQAINGIGEPGQLYANDSYIFGSMYRSSWAQVHNTKVSYEDALERNPIADGVWDYDPEMSSWRSKEFDELSPAPTDEYLALVWA
ncbi:hypothetical protein ACPW96_21985 [Micromonospora sp. DT81.3]|uniref:hypothetical protein n=1 Tax=Micromonospora sp. DT81.3 TaxID=3416523 RepID=UPI003CF592FC